MSGPAPIPPALLADFAPRLIDWQRRAREVCREKFGTGVPADRKEWARRARFLSYRGFATEIICAVLASTTDGEDS